MIFEITQEIVHRVRYAAAHPATITLSGQRQLGRASLLHKRRGKLGLRLIPHGVWPVNGGPSGKRKNPNPDYDPKHWHYEN